MDSEEDGKTKFYGKVYIKTTKRIIDNIILILLKEGDFLPFFCLIFIVGKVYKGDIIWVH